MWYLQSGYRAEILSSTSSNDCVTVLALSRILNQVILAAWTIVVLVRMLLSSQAEVWQNCIVSLVGDSEDRRCWMNESVLMWLQERLKDCSVKPPGTLSMTGWQQKCYNFLVSTRIPECLCCFTRYRYPTGKRREASLPWTDTWCLCECASSSGHEVRLPAVVSRPSATPPPPSTCLPVPRECVPAAHTCGSSHRWHVTGAERRSEESTVCLSGSQGGSLWENTQLWSEGAGG